MQLYLLDTDTIIYFIEGDYDVVRRLSEVSLVQLYVSDVTCAELYYGAYQSESPERKIKTINGVIGNLSTASFSMKESKLFAELKSKLKQEGGKISDLDLMKASIAIMNNYTLVTNRINELKDVKGLTLESWSLR